MKPIILISIALLFLSGCIKFDQDTDADPIFSGRVESFYYLDQSDKVSGFTRLDKGLPETSALVNEEVFVEVQKDWVVVRLLNRKGAAYIVPRERVRSIIVGTTEGNR